MLYQQNFIRFNTPVAQAVAQIFNVAERNQRNENDLLLVLIHGFKIKQETFFRSNGWPVYVFGPDYVGFDANTFRNFFERYRQNQLDEDDFNAIPIEERMPRVHFTINIEMSIYMKVWETDFFIRQLYNLARLVNNEIYNWDFNEQRFEDLGEKFIQHQIIDRLNGRAPRMATLLKNIYFPQIRGAIAHARYHFNGVDSISLTNKGYNNRRSYDKGSITINEWNEIFSRVMLLYQHFWAQTEFWYSRYIDKLINKNGMLEVTTPDGIENIPPDDRHMWGRV